MDLTHVSFDHILLDFLFLYYSNYYLFIYSFVILSPFILTLLIVLHYMYLCLQLINLFLDEYENRILFVIEFQIHVIISTITTTTKVSFVSYLYRLCVTLRYFNIEMLRDHCLFIYCKWYFWLNLSYIKMLNIIFELNCIHNQSIDQNEFRLINMIEIVIDKSWNDCIIVTIDFEMKIRKKIEKKETNELSWRYAWPHLP